MARPGGLGRGLGALIPTGTVAEQAGGLADIPTSEIRPNPQQPREHFDEEALAALADSIREVGLLQPVLVRAAEDGGYELIAGERRWRATRRVGLQTIPAMVRVADDAAMLQHAIVENIQREELNPLEEAAAYQQLIEDFSLTHDDVATRVGRSHATITNTLRLLQLPPSIQRCVKEGTIRMGHARALLSTPDQRVPGALGQARHRRGSLGAAGRRSDSDGGGSFTGEEPSRGRGLRSRRPVTTAWSARARGAARRLSRDPGANHHGCPARQSADRVREPRGSRAHLPCHEQRFAGTRLTSRSVPEAGDDRRF